MTDLASSPLKIQVEEAAYRGPVSENLASRLGGSINFLLDAVLPVGCPVFTYLTEAQFQAEVGNTNWVLADGRSSNGTRYKDVTGFTTIPDMRGVSPRGKDAGRGLNPDGDLPIGTYQADQNKSHNHTVHAAGTGSNGSHDVSGGSDHFNSDPSFFSISLDPSGGNEARGKTNTGNFMVRIN
jgi:hypothetical protein